LQTTPDAPIPDLTIPNGLSPKVDVTSQYKKNCSTTALAELDECFCITSITKPWEIDPLKWWYLQHDQFPNLYYLVHDILCIPGTVSFGSFFL
jgi:hypothetical protein